MAAQAPPPAALELPEGRDSEALRELKALHGPALQAYARAHQAQDAREIALLLPALRQNLELRLKIAEKAERDRPAFDPLRDATIAELRDRLVSVLDGFPEAREAVVEALRTT